ncbi:hypothetical protein SEA_TARSUSIV_75 [Mycobacterium phage TarsusIV]|nr:hypothetical protein SEA_TARSUSIV_75 [Mycobacterium phage TarsusIV]
MFAEGDEVVDRQFFAEGHAAVGIVRSSGPRSSQVEWPDGQLEDVLNDELQKA